MGSAPSEEKEDLSCVSERTLESSIAERLHDLARNSMDSVGVLGRTNDMGSQRAGPSSSMFSSCRDVHFKELIGAAPASSKLNHNLYFSLNGAYLCLYHGLFYVVSCRYIVRTHLVKKLYLVISHDHKGKEVKEISTCKQYCGKPCKYNNP